MPGTARTTDTRRRTGTALAFLGAAGALAAAAAVTAGAVTAAAQPPAAAHAPAAHAGHAPGRDTLADAITGPAHPAHAHAAHAAHAASAGHRAQPGRRRATNTRRRHHPARPYAIYDSVTPTAIPAHHAIATYADGNYAATPAQVTGRKTVLWIDTNGSDPHASALDVEPGDATPAAAATWARHKLTTQPATLARIYTMRSEWPAVKTAIATLPAHMQTHIRWWIADPTGTPHNVPGADATQWYWGTHYDITNATTRF